MRSYKALFICRQDISASQVETLANKFQEIITESNGKMGRRENWGLKTLAYRIKKNRKGHIALFDVNASHDAVTELERRMTLSEDAIRYMTTRTETLQTADSVGVKSSDERPARGSR